MSESAARGAAALVAPFLCVVVGIAIAANEQIGFVLAATAIAACALAAPTAVWVGAAIVAALTFKGLTGVGALPSVAAFLDIPLSWGALIVALIRSRGASNRVATLLWAFVGLLAAVSISWLFNPSEVLRPILYVALLAEPFVLISALLLDPPTARTRLWLIRLVAVLFALQIPVLYGQYLLVGGSDGMQGTLYGAGAGAHTVSAIVLLGALWMVTRSVKGLWYRLVLAVPVLMLPILADAKQVVVAAPVVALAWAGRGGRAQWLVRVAVVGATTAALFFLVPAGNAALSFFERGRSTGFGKVETAKFVWSETSSDPASLIFGKGPAETVSRSAFMTLTGFRHEGSPLEVLGLHEAEVAAEAQRRALVRSGGGTSFNSGVSSALGVFGDLGIFGAAAYLIVLLTVIRNLYTRPGNLAATALAGWMLFVVLGFVFDWWEQPPFTLFLAALTGLALTARPVAAHSGGP